MTQLKRPPVFREDGTIEIHLQRGYVALIDAVDAHLAEFLWTANVTPEGNVYAQRTYAKGKVTALHREVLGLKVGDRRQGDHKDGNTLDCRRNNLRIATARVNRRNRTLMKNNTSGHIGVRFSKRDDCWIASIDGRHLGSFAILEDAIEARLEAEREAWGVQPRRAAAHRATPE